MKRGILYGVGVGPGDPELITRKAQRIIAQAAVLAVPDKGSGEKTALTIAGELAEGKEILLCDAPMVRDEAALDAAYEANADRVCALLDGGKDVAFLTLGDPTVYSTYLYLHRKVVARGYEAEIIPGVPSFCAVAARLGAALCEKSERLLIVPASHKDVDDCLDVDANLVFMKAGREIGALKEKLAEKGLLERASMVANCGMEGEAVYPRFGRADRWQRLLLRGAGEEGGRGLNIRMTGLDWRKAPIGLREALSFTRSRVVELDRLLRAAEGVEGCVLLSTCNRTELYLSCASGAEPEPGALLCAAAGLPYAPFAGAFVTRTGEEAARHLMEVAGGLRSQIWGEDQILTQVKGAGGGRREAGTADGVLEILFRNAAAAGKEIKTKVPLTGVPRSAAQSAVERLARDAGGLEGKRALVIGNGEMGRLSAALLHRLGCAVTVTLRTYRHGETVVPAGCAVAPYEERYAAMKGVDLLLSATTSPHYTISARELAAVEDHPRLLADLAIPRDIEPAVGELPGVTLYNVDSLGVDTRREVPAAAAEIVERHLEQMAQWENYRSCLPGLERVKQAVAARVLSTDLDGPEARGLVELAVGRAVDLLSGALKENLTPEELERCARKIEVHTAAKPRWPLPEQRPLRFPLFVNLAGEKAVVVGGGAVACRRAEVLSRFGAEVTVIAPVVRTRPRAYSGRGGPYAPGDLAGAALAVAATDDRAVNGRWGRRPKVQGIPVSVADCPEECTFFFPAVCTGENLVAGSSAGATTTPGHRPGAGHPQRIGGIGMKTIRVGSRESRLAGVPVRAGDGRHPRRPPGGGAGAGDHEDHRRQDTGPHPGQGGRQGPLCQGAGRRPAGRPGWI